MVKLHRFLLKIYFGIFFYFSFKKIKKAKNLNEIEQILMEWLFDSFVVKINDNTNHISIILLEGKSDSIIMNIFKDSTKTTVKFSNNSLIIHADIICIFLEYLEKNNFLDLIYNLNNGYILEN